MMSLPSHVLIQVSLEDITFAAYRALQICIRVLCLHVTSQIALLRKGMVAFRAYILLHLHMYHADVAPQIIG